MTDKLPQDSLAEYIAKLAASYVVIGWTIKGELDRYTTDPKTCAEWHKSGWSVMPVYINYWIDLGAQD